MPEKIDKNQELLDLVKRQYDREIDRVNDLIETKHREALEKIEGIGDSLKSDIVNISKERKDQIETVESKINKKLDAVDESLRGNGRIGIFEQLRGIKTQLRAIFICLLLLFGFKVWSMGFEEWVKSFFSREQHNTQMIDTTRDMLPNTQMVDATRDTSPIKKMTTTHPTTRSR